MAPCAHALGVVLPGRPSSFSSAGEVRPHIVGGFGPELLLRLLVPQLPLDRHRPGRGEDDDKELLDHGLPCIMRVPPPEMERRWWA